MTNTHDCKVNCNIVCFCFKIQLHQIMTTSNIYGLESDTVIFYFKVFLCVSDLVT